MTAHSLRPTGIKPPRATRKSTAATHHGITIEDEYSWLRAENWQEVMRAPDRLDSAIRAHLEAENEYTNAALASTATLQSELFDEMKARIKEDDSTVPTPDGLWAYSYRFVTGGQYPQLCRQPREGGDVTILLDGNELAKDKPYWSLGGSQHSPDHKRLAYAVDEKGSELYTIRIRDLDTGQDLEDVIHDTRGDFVWTNDSNTIVYVRLDENHRPLSVYRHVIGTPHADDVRVYHEPDSAFYVGIGKTQSSRFILIDAHDHQTSEVYLIDADNPSTEPRLVAPRQAGHEYSIEHHNDALVILTNSGDAVDFRIVEAPVNNPGQENWREIIPHRPGRLIIEAVAYKNHLVRLEREDGLPRIVISKFDDSSEHEISFDEEAYALGLSHGYEYDTTAIRFTYSSMTTPAEVYDYDMESRARTLRKRQEVPSGHNPANYVTRRLQAPTANGETVPVSLLYHKDTPLDGSAPALLYGYGSYGISIPASFSTTRLSLVDRGFVYAIAHIRGGKEKGYRWYTDGKLEKKTNTFKDFIAAGEHLVSEGFTKRGRIVANGGSAGGMLMGAVANMAPDLFLGIIADVPFVDVLNTMLDATLPLTPPEWLEWGNPLKSPEQFEIIRSYSPYDNVKDQPYPHILAYTGLTDPRVTYWEPAKWIARLREHNTSDKLVLLRINMEAGHSGASGRFTALKETAHDYAFALLIAGKTETAVS
ncbi:S9 family peptidase [Filomicrobium sp.]|uniref:S9 family peptidase n=1 Tax=Filomicrobium sp. TaxID=2024831 RepID=UPI002582DA3A|nr:S9 family peptidase [Filomicrobium sp.]MCV0370789.1 S9 family peptidase [Filomicrobium sp.]